MNKSLLEWSGLDVPIIPNGSTPNPGWALARLNDGDNPALTEAYLYPETSNPVRLYLIDNSVDNSSGWFNANPNLTIQTELVGTPLNAGTPRGTLHGTRMLGIIAGPETGSALGTPIEVINYDIYPDGEGSNSSSGLLAEAVERAVFHQLFNSEKPAIICIAAGSAFAGASPVLQDAVDFAVSEGITVIVAAGNFNKPAANYVPAAYGTMDGVICVGASSQSNGKLSNSNFGAAVDFYAPGDSVRTVRVSAPQSGFYDASTGTSPAAALATGAALATLSMHPNYSPAELEASLKASTHAGVAVNLVQLPPIDSDGDGVHDVLERFAGSDPLDLNETPAKPTVAGSSLPGGMTTVSISFTIDSDLFNAGNPFELNDGITWRVMESPCLKSWSTSTSGELSYGAVSNGRIPVTYTRVGDESCCYLKLEITPAP
ncbi:S8 family serine peptidase [Haloferula sp.]|uniref:S8 family serine peptidase n=1 Tax=Haloferula sp. TaxID=2497595 RepID=UPI003C72218E